MTSTIGAFILGVGLAISLFNFWKSMRSGASAGRNPWNADTLEWSSQSPPPAYGYVHTPRVRSRHPLWDDYDEEYDPGDQRVYDRGRLSLASTWLDAEPVALSRMPGDTLTPLYLTLAMTLLFAALLAGMLWFSFAALVVNAAIMAFWLWPRQERIAA